MSEYTAREKVIDMSLSVASRLADRSFGVPGPTIETLLEDATKVLAWIDAIHKENADV